MFLLSLVTFFPLVGGAALLFLPKERHGLIRWTALGISLIEIILAFVLSVNYLQAANSIFQAPYQEKWTWIAPLGINYSLTIDGISLLLVGLTVLLTAVCIAASFRIEQKSKNYMAFMLMLESGILGVFLASNLFLFYIFWELMLIPAYFLLGIWGGERRVYAAFKFVLYTAVGGFLMLAGIIALGYFHQQAAGASCGYSLELSTLLNNDPTCKGTLPVGIQTWLLLAFAA